MVDNDGAAAVKGLDGEEGRVSLICLIAGHDWFPTVRIRRTGCTGVGPWFDEEWWHRDEYEERICLRCYSSHVQHVAVIESWRAPAGKPAGNGLLLCDDGSEIYIPAFVAEPIEVLGLPGEWIS